MCLGNASDVLLPVSALQFCPLNATRPSGFAQEKASKHLVQNRER